MILAMAYPAVRDGNQDPRAAGSRPKAPAESAPGRRDPRAAAELLQKAIEASALSGDVQSQATADQRLTATIHNRAEIQFYRSAEGGRFRMDLRITPGSDPSYSGAVLFDGSDLWLNDRNQVLKGKLDDVEMFMRLSPSSVTFAGPPDRVLAILRSWYSIDRVGEAVVDQRKYTVLHGTLTRERQKVIYQKTARAMYHELRAYLDPETRALQRVTFHDPDGVQWASFVWGPWIRTMASDAKRFVYTPPEGATVMPMSDFFGQFTSSAVADPIDDGEPASAPAKK
jgi:hypothetical protein